MSPRKQRFGKKVGWLREWNCVSLKTKVSHLIPSLFVEALASVTENQSFVIPLHPNTVHRQRSGKDQTSSFPTVPVGRSGWVILSSEMETRDVPVVQWLRIHHPMQGTRVLSLVG